LLYLYRRRLKARIHGRQRSDRKRRFLLSAVAPSTSTRHPREAKPINWAQRGGLASGPGNCVLTPRPHFTAPSCTLGNQVVGASDGPPFRQERRPTRICRTPGAGSGLLAEASTLRACRCLEIDHIRDSQMFVSVSPVVLNCGQVIAFERFGLHRRRCAIQYRPADGVGAAARALSFP
jgi:hypothetical protein